MKKYLFNIILIIIWLFIIFSFSAQDGLSSQSISDGFITKIINIVSDNKTTTTNSPQIVNKYSKLVRKSAHFSVYFILAILVFRLYYKMYGLIPKTLIYTIIFSFIYACSDEIHQLFVNGRSCEILDVLLDSSAAFIATIIISLFHLKKNFTKGNL